jgi:hypothetical protein
VIRVTVKAAAAKKHLEKIRAGLTPEALDPVVERSAFKALAAVAAASPRRYFGQLQGGWRVEKPAIGTRLLRIPPHLKGPTGKSAAQILLFVNDGTANNGSGFIYPVHKKFLYLPLNRNAALGWRPGLKFGTDYVLRSRVRGIVGRHFVEPVFAKAREEFKEALKSFVRKLISAP